MAPDKAREARIEATKKGRTTVRYLLTRNYSGSVLEGGEQLHHKGDTVTVSVDKRPPKSWIKLDPDEDPVVVEKASPQTMAEAATRRPPPTRGRDADPQPRTTRRNK